MELHCFWVFFSVSDLFFLFFSLCLSLIQLPFPYSFFPFSPQPFHFPIPDLLAWFSSSLYILSSYLNPFIYSSPLYGTDFKLYDILSSVADSDNPWRLNTERNLHIGGTGVNPMSYQVSQWLVPLCNLCNVSQKSYKVHRVRSSVQYIMKLTKALRQNSNTWTYKVINH